VPDTAAVVTAPQRPAPGAGEHEPVVTGDGEGHDVRGKVRCDHRRNGYGPVTGVRLGRPDSVLSADVDDVDAAYALAQATGLLPDYDKCQACIADVHSAFR
jgi:hypothetical protein